MFVFYRLVSLKRQIGSRDSDELMSAADQSMERLQTHRGLAQSRGNSVNFRIKFEAFMDLNRQQISSNSMGID